MFGKGMGIQPCRAGRFGGAPASSPALRVGLTARVQQRFDSTASSTRSSKAAEDGGAPFISRRPRQALVDSQEGVKYKDNDPRENAGL